MLNHIIITLDPRTMEKLNVNHLIDTMARIQAVAHRGVMVLLLGFEEFDAFVIQGVMRELTRRGISYTTSLQEIIDGTKAGVSLLDWEFKDDEDETLHRCGLQRSPTLDTASHVGSFLSVGKRWVDSLWRGSRRV